MELPEWADLYGALKRHVELPQNDFLAKGERAEKWSVSQAVEAARRDATGTSLYLIHAKDTQLATDTVSSTGSLHYALSTFTPYFHLNSALTEAATVDRIDFSRPLSRHKKFEVVRVRKFKRYAGEAVFRIVQAIPRGRELLLQLDGAVEVAVNKTVVELVDLQPSLRGRRFVERIMTPDRIVVSVNPTEQLRGAVKDRGACHIIGEIENQQQLYYTEAVQRMPQMELDVAPVAAEPEMVRWDWETLEGYVPVPGTPAATPVQHQESNHAERSSGNATPLSNTTEGMAKPEAAALEVDWGDDVIDAFFHCNLPAPEEETEIREPPPQAEPRDVLEALIKRYPPEAIVLALKHRFSATQIKEAIQSALDEIQPAPSSHQSQPPVTGNGFPYSDSLGIDATDSQAPPPETQTPSTQRAPRPSALKMIRHRPAQAKSSDQPGPLSLHEVSRLVGDAVHRGEKRRAIVLAHERSMGEEMKKAFLGHDIPAESFTKGRFKESNYHIQMSGIAIIILNPQVAINAGDNLWTSIFAVFEPVGMTLSPGLAALKSKIADKEKFSVQWLLMEACPLS